jgi:MFS family permease
VLFSKLADKSGRKRSIFLSLAMASLGNLIMFLSGLGYTNTTGALASMLIGRVIMGLGVGGIDSVIPTYSSELSNDEARGKALAQEFQSNIFGLLMAFGINLGVTRALGKYNHWAWRIPIIVMQVYPVLLMAFVERLPESPRFFVYHGRNDEAQAAMKDIYGSEGEERFQDLLESHEKEKEESVGYFEMLSPSHPQFHPTMVVIMGQVNQALTGYGAVSVYGPQIFQVSALRAAYLSFHTKIESIRRLRMCSV